MLFTQNISLFVEAGFCQIRSHMCKFSTNIIFGDFEIACMYALQKLKHLHTCVQKIQHEGCVEMLMQCEVKPSVVSECCVFRTHKHRL